MRPALTDGTFEELGVAPVLCEAVAKLGWQHPTLIQQEAVPVALSGKVRLWAMGVERLSLWPPCADTIDRM